MSRLIRKETGKGKIFKIDKNKVWIIPDRDCIDSQPSKGKGCASGCASCTHTTSRTVVFFQDTSDLKPEQRICFHHYVPDSGLTGLLVFGIPVVLAFLSMIIWYHFEPQKIESPGAILTTTLAFSSGFVILKFLDLIFRKKYPSRLLSMEEKADKAESTDREITYDG